MIVPDRPDATLYGDTEVTVFGTSGMVLAQGVVDHNEAEMLLANATSPDVHVINFDDSVNRVRNLVFVDAISNIRTVKIR